MFKPLTGLFSSDKPNKSWGCILVYSSLASSPRQSRHPTPRHLQSLTSHTTLPMVLTKLPCTQGILHYHTSPYRLESASNRFMWLITQVCLHVRLVCKRSAHHSQHNVSLGLMQQTDSGRSLIVFLLLSG